MENAKYLIFIIILFNAKLAIGSIIIDQPIEKYINESQLIIKGKVINKEARNEEHLLNQYSVSQGVASVDRKNVKGIYTTFTVQIDEMLRGKHDDQSIEVKMLGGCDEKGKCFRLSSNYDYQINDEVLIFLNYDEVNDYFQSTSNGITAYVIWKNGKLVKAGDYIPVDSIHSAFFEKEQNRLISVDELKKVIAEMTNE